MLNARFAVNFRVFSHARLLVMRRAPRSLGATPWLAATVALPLPALAWLQYDWVNQLAAADRDRRERTLRAAGAQFTAAVDNEIGRLTASLQLDGAMVERRDWDAYALRYDSAVDGAECSKALPISHGRPNFLASPWRSRRVMSRPMPYPHTWERASSGLMSLPPDFSATIISISKCTS